MLFGGRIPRVYAETTFDTLAPAGLFMDPVRAVGSRGAGDGCGCYPRTLQEIGRPGPTPQGGLMGRS